MKNLNVTRVIAFLMIATFATSFMTACGDGKSHKRTKNNRNLSDKPAADAPATDKPATDAPATDKPATDAPATDKPADDTPPTTDKPVTDAPAGTDVQDQDALKKRAADLKSIEDYMKSLTDSGTLIDKGGLSEGKYKLTRVDSAVRYMFKQEDARGMQSANLNEVSGGVQLVEGSKASVGLVAEHQLASRDLEIALSFEVKLENGVFTAARTSFSPAILKSSVTNKLEVSSGLMDSKAEASPIRASMIDVLQSTAQSASSDITYTVTDENNRNVVLRLRKVSETELHMIIRVDEEISKDGDATTYDFAREIVLTYSFEKAAAADDNSVVLTQPDAPAAPPTGTEVGKDDDLAKRM